MDIPSFGPIVPIPDDATTEIRHLLELLEHGDGLMVKTTDGQEIALSDTMIAIARRAISQLAHDSAVCLIPENHALNESIAAHLLNVSPADYRKMLDDGAMPYHRFGPVRKVTFADLLAYHQAREAIELEALDEIARLSQEMGEY